MTDKRKNRTFHRGLLTTLTLLWMIFIFFMSSADQQESDYQSDTVIDVICSTFIDGYDNMTPEEKLELQDRLTFPVRKAAHMTEYAVLGILLSLTASEYLLCCSFVGTPGSAVFLSAVLIGFLYACSDEFHQRFVPGRSGEFRDVLIDTAGVLIGTTIITILLPALKRRSVKKKGA